MDFAEQNFYIGCLQITFFDKEGVLIYVLISS